ncbi:hypothetical protein BA895_16680 [Humibacillus sp. DSM 29435]|uniref:questin oxidase family protein n=1 Tax=Humibacillus sp. DSM 29435 TaxID=1869167 RepID=UPI000872F621|nr:questin oxidase family protein [Humibacillus sp. DSM 29435]OFE17399.1 hypothetical protein BA895_16680 [Humibacillus sp. DSM 29435]
MTNDNLLEALDRLRDTGPEFGGFLANHGPMAAEALTQMDAASAVPAWVDRYRTRLDAAPTVGHGIARSQWREHLGNERLIGDWTGLMRREIGEQPWQDMLGTWWPRLLPGMAASATHGVIRVAHAVRSLRSAGREPEELLTDELAQGLAFWAARYQTVPGAPDLHGSDAAVVATAHLPRLDPSLPGRGEGITGRLLALDHLPRLPHALNAWGAPADPDLALDELIGASARVLAARDDAPIAFCHAVTAPAAVRLVLPELDAGLAVASVAVSWQVVGSIIAAYAAPRHEAESHDAQELPSSEVDELSHRAVQHGDEHVIKLTEACLREHARTGDDTLLVAARRFRDRVGVDR